MTTRVVVADDQVLIRTGLAGIIDTAADLRVVGQAGTGREAIELTERHRPDVVLMDVRMPDLDGIAATQMIAAGSAARVLILTTFDLDEYVYAALRAGASGFLLKDTPPPDLIAAIRVVAAGDALLAPQVTRRLINTFAAQAGPNDPAPPDSGGWTRRAGRLNAITDREQQVLSLVAAGLSNGEIGTQLHITAGTVKTHVAHLLTKLDARDRIQLVILAHRAGRG